MASRSVDDASGAMRPAEERGSTRRVESPSDGVLLQISKYEYLRGYLKDGQFVQTHESPVIISPDSFPISAPAVHGVELKNHIALDTRVLKRVGEGLYQEGILDAEGRFVPTQGRDPIRIDPGEFPISAPPILGAGPGEVQLSEDDD